MKYLMYLLIVVLVLVGLFLGKGLLTPSVYYESEVVVNKPVQEAWAIMSDPSKLPEWIEGYIRNELISGTANTIGAVSKVYVDQDGQESVMQETITKLVPNKVMGMDFTMDFMDMEYEINFSEHNDGTTILSKSTTKGNGLFAKSIISFMKGGMKAQEDKNMKNLKKVIEENTKDYFKVADSTVPELGTE